MCDLLCYHCFYILLLWKTLSHYLTLIILLIFIKLLPNRWEKMTDHGSLHNQRRSDSGGVSQSKLITYSASSFPLFYSCHPPSPLLSNGSPSLTNSAILRIDKTGENRPQFIRNIPLRLPRATAKTINWPIPLAPFFKSGNRPFPSRLNVLPHRALSGEYPILPRVPPHRQSFGSPHSGS